MKIESPGGGISVDLADVLASLDDLGEVKAALIREATIREVMRESGEDRRTVTDMMDAMVSMGQEAVLELTEGEPTTLADALQRYVDQLPQAVTTMTGEVSDQIAGDLSALLAYPWPDGPAPANAVLGIEYADDENLIIRVGGVEVATANHDEHGWSGMEAAQKAAEGVHRALLAVLRPAQKAQDGPAAGACPTCHATGGFHEDGPHRAERDAIPPHLVRPSNSAVRRAARDQ